MSFSLHVINHALEPGQVNIYQSGGHRIVLSIPEAVELRDRLTRQLPPPPVASVLTLLQALDAERKALADAEAAKSVYDRQHACSILVGTRKRVDAIRAELAAMSQRVAS